MGTGARFEHPARFAERLHRDRRHGSGDDVEDGRDGDIVRRDEERLVVIALDDEKIGSKITAFNADFHVTKNKVILTDFISKPLLNQVLTPEKSAPIETDTFAIQKFAKKELDQLPAATKRLINPDRFPVYLTKKLFDLQQKLISEYKNI